MREGAVTGRMKGVDEFGGNWEFDSPGRDKMGRVEWVDDEGEGRGGRVGKKCPLSSALDPPVTKHCI